MLISKDSNVGEIAILDKDYPNTMLCGGIYKLPVIKNKYYLLAFIKSELFRQQIDFLVPRGSTIRHGKTKFLDCLIPMPNKNRKETILYIELLMQAIPIPDFPSNKEALITKLYSNSNAVYNCSKYSLDNFLEYDNKFNKLAGIYEIDKSMKLLQERLTHPKPKVLMQILTVLLSEPRSL